MLIEKETSVRDVIQFLKSPDIHSKQVRRETWLLFRLFVLGWAVNILVLLWLSVGSVPTWLWPLLLLGSINPIVRVPAAFALDPVFFVVFSTTRGAWSAPKHWRFGSAASDAATTRLGTPAKLQRMEMAYEALSTSWRDGPKRLILWTGICVFQVGLITLAFAQPLWGGQILKGLGALKRTFHTVNVSIGWLVGTVISNCLIAYAAG